MGCGMIFSDQNVVMEKRDQCILVALDKVGLSSGILDRFLNHILYFIPVAGINAVDNALEVLLDLAKHLPLIAVGNKGDCHANTTEATSTTDAVQIGLVVGCVGALTGRVFLGNILKARKFSFERENG
jgi:hypothetical protein